MSRSPGRGASRSSCAATRTGVASVVSASIRASTRPLVALAKPSQGRDRRRCACRCLVTPDSLLGGAGATRLRPSTSGRGRRGGSSQSDDRRASRAGIDSGVGAQPSDDDTGARAAANRRTRSRRSPPVSPHPPSLDIGTPHGRALTLPGETEPATSQRARRSGRSGATPSPSARRRPTRARGGRRRRPADRSR